MRIERTKCLSYVLSLAVLATSVLPGGVQASAATLTQDDQTLQMEVDEQGNKVYTLTQDMDKGLNLYVEEDETVRINGNGHTIKGQDGSVPHDGDQNSKEYAECGLKVSGKGTAIVENITLIGGGGDREGYSYSGAASGMIVSSHVIFEGNVKIMAGETAAHSDGSKGLSFSGGGPYGLSYPQMTVKKGAKVTIQGGDGGKCEYGSAKGGIGIYIGDACLLVEKQAELSLVGGKGSDGVQPEDSKYAYSGGQGGNALEFWGGRIDASLQGSGDTEYGTLTLSPGAGGAPSNPETATTGAIGMKVRCDEGYVSDKAILEDYSAELKKVTVRHQVVDESGNLAQILDEHVYYTRYSDFRYGSALRYLTDKTQGCQVKGIRQQMQDGSLEEIGFDTPITDGATVVVLCQCGHTSGIHASASEEDTYLCNTCNQKMCASITDSDGNVRYLKDNYISDNLISSANEGDTIQLLGKNGTYGDSLHWYLTKETSTDTESLRCKLTIEGTGGIKDGSNVSQSWMCPYSPDGSFSHIYSIEIKSGVTKIEKGAFQDYNNLEDVTIANGIEVEEGAFQNNAPAGKVTVLADEKAESNLTKEGLVQAGLPDTANYSFPVVFEGNNEQDRTVEYHAYGEAVTPAAITYSGHTLQGWYQDKSCKQGTEWNTETDRVKGAMTLYAKWKSNSSSGGGSGVVTPEVTPSPSLSETPSASPTVSPSIEPSETPGSEPGDVLVIAPDTEPSTSPSAEPSAAPTEPSTKPTVAPDSKPTATPGNKPTAKPTKKPSSKPAAKPAAKGKKIKDSKTGATYKVTSSNTKKPTVSYYACPSKKSRQKKIVISKQVTIQGVTYKVTSIAANAFRGNKRLTSITIGSNITVIGKNVFRNCKKLKKLVINSKKLTMKFVGKNAFKGISDKAVVQTPKKLTKKYRKLLRKKGLPESAQVRKKGK